MEDKNLYFTLNPQTFKKERYRKTFPVIRLQYLSSQFNVKIDVDILFECPHCKQLVSINRSFHQSFFTKKGQEISSDNKFRMIWMRLVSTGLTCHKCLKALKLDPVILR